ncbi:phage protein [Pragia fontium]|uniref:DUF2597 domain-containing protein n=1 Tax=Pragia fontium DSM 5563 = ATCC 49100 TaxID=1122977 RepID=A0AAJ5BGM4_9GAMM|nr:Protein of unknown function [Pragia fontium DSM 5563 = ATCC 49100]
MERLSGSSFDINYGDVMINVENISLDITDNTAVAKTNGIPDGHTKGDKSAEGELELDSQNFNLLSEVAARAGSWSDFPVEDITFYANTGEAEMKVTVFGCKLVVSGLLSIDPNSADKSKHKVKYFSTSPDFVHINGVPYLSARDTRNLLE